MDAFANDRQVRYFAVLLDPLIPFQTKAQVDLFLNRVSESCIQIRTAVIPLRIHAPLNEEPVLHIIMEHISVNLAVVDNILRD